MKKLFYYASIILAMVMTVSVFTACGDDDEDDSTKDNRVKSVVPDKYRTLLEEYIPIYDGVNPPNVEGVFLSSPTILVYSSDGKFSAGHQFADKYYRFSNQNSKNNTIDYESVQSSEKCIGDGAFISGSDNNFTIYFNLNGTSGTATFKEALVLSGTKTSEGIKNLEYAFVMLEKNDPDKKMMAEGVYRIIKDGDAFSPYAEWPAGKSRAAAEPIIEELETSAK